MKWHSGVPPGPRSYALVGRSSYPGDLEQRREERDSHVEVHRSRVPPPMGGKGNLTFAGIQESRRHGKFLELLNKVSDKTYPARDDDFALFPGGRRRVSHGTGLSQLPGKIIDMGR